ncbi:MAG: SoxR reducing system RseC family protein [Gammaproteobacteria bacterium]
MITEPATVLSVDGTNVWVRCETQASCARCAEGRGCGAWWFGEGLKSRLGRVRVINPGLSLREGQSVVIGLSESSLVRAAFLIYGAPILALIGGAYVGGRLPGLGVEAAAVTGGIIAFAAALVAVRRFGLRSHRTTLQPVVLGAREPTV